MIAAKKYSTILFFAALILMGIPAVSVAADARPQAANHYDVAFAYAKLTGTKPDYAGLLRADRSWQKLGPIEQAKQEKFRLADLADTFASFSPTTSPLTVRLPVRVHLSSKPTALVLGYLAANLPYFPFWDGNRILTLYTQDLPLLSVLPLEDDLALRRASYLIEDENDLFLDLIPSFNPARTPTSVDNEPQILIPTRVARIRLYNRQGTLIWDWTNSGYDYIDRRIVNHR